MILAASYARFSHAEGDSDSCKLQTSRCDEAANTNKWKLVLAFEDDGISGREMLKRPGFKKLLAAAKRGEFTILIVRDLDRFTRGEMARVMGILQELADLGVKVFQYIDSTFVNIDDEQGLFTAFKAYSNRREATKASPRIKDKLSKRADEGGITHGVPYGFKNARRKPDGTGGEFVREGTFPVGVRDPKTFPVLGLMAKLFIKHGTFLGVARALNVKNIPSPEGGTWGGPSVKSVLINPTYRGNFRRGRMMTTDSGGTLKRVKAPDDNVKSYDHPEFVAWDAATVKKIDRLVEIQSRNHTWGTGRKHLSSGIVRCCECGTGVVTASSQRSKYQSYCCAKAKMKACKGIGYKPKHKVDAAVVMACQSLLTDDILEQVSVLIRQTLNVATHASTREVEIDRLSRDLKQAEKRAKGFEEMAADSEGAERERHRTSLREQLVRLGELRKSLDEARVSPVPLDPKAVLAHMEKRIKDLRATLSVGGIDALPAVLSVLGEERFVATRTPDGWALRARVGVGFLFDKDDGNQKAKISGNVTGVTIVPITSPASPAPAAATPAAPTPATPATGSGPVTATGTTAAHT